MSNNSNNRTTQIVVADNSAVVRHGIMTLLRQCHGLDCDISEVTTIEQLQAIAATHNNVIVIINPLLGHQMDMAQLRLQSDGVQLVALISTVVGHQHLAGYDARITIEDSADDIAHKLRQLIDRHNQPHHSNVSLTEREKQVTLCAIRGMTNRAIAQQLGLSIHTVITHRRNINHKFKVHTTSALTISALKSGLVTLDDLPD